ncbi:DUF3054 domain-containing protein [Corynebacterium aquilae]|uniref:Membrane protein n=1 Tax=Corynebacterium aquilae DSM 44791 TaxID=1431546 RepID=A0A1L7CIK2_9CORY|nr:DUF3054 domain-containing protein [Corynebacterium aquilae]APT85603.1 membrane protein [Corynebacterium aquilae DSM 44791]
MTSRTTRNPSKFLVFDLLAVAVFALLARAAHQSESMPFTFTGWLSTVWPFLLGTLIMWVVVPAVRKAPVALVPAGVAVWLGTAACGLVVWGLRHDHVPHISFIIVATVMSGLLLLGWRGIVAVLSHRR